MPDNEVMFDITSSGMRSVYTLGFNVYFRNRDDAFNFEVECPLVLKKALENNPVKQVLFIGSGFDDRIDIKFLTGKKTILMNVNNAALAKRMNKEAINIVGMYLTAKTISIRPKHLYIGDGKFQSRG